MSLPGEDSYRMSRGNGSPKEGSAPPNPGESRRLSLWHLPVASHQSPSPDGRAQRVQDPEKTNPETTPLDLDEVIRDGLSISESPEEARSWLIGFGSLKIGTDVSRRLVDLREDHGGDQGTTSLLPLLIQWLPSWVQKAEKARKENKNSKQSATKEQKNLDWLLQYVSDYLDLGHAGFDQRELSQMVEAITALCLNASRKEDINAGISILYTIMSHFDYPPDGLDQTLVVLCASVANLSEVPDHLHDCARMLAAGDLSEVVMSTLYSFVRTPTSENPVKNLSHARGATRILRNLIDRSHKEGGFVVNLHHFLEVLHFAAQQGIFRFCYDILNALHAILKSHRVLLEIESLEFGVLLEVIRLCLQINPPRAANQEEERQYERHSRDREAISKKLAQDFLRIWDSLSSSNQVAIKELFLTFPQFASQTLLVLTLDYAKETYLLSPDCKLSRQYTDKIFTEIVQNHSLPSAARLKGLEVLVQSVAPSSDAMAEPTDAYLSLFDNLVEQLGTERDGHVLDTTLRSLEYMAKSSEEAVKDTEFITRVVPKIQDLIIRGPAGVSRSDDIAVSATKVLITIFSRGIHVNPEIAKTTFAKLLEVAGPACKSRPARLEAKRLLFRLRADDAGFIYIASASESQTIAGALLRTQASVDAFNSEVPGPQRHSSGGGISAAKSEVTDAMWIYPDTERPTYLSVGQTSHVLNVNKAGYPQVQAELDMDTWLMSIIKCLQADQDWETYSYTVVHAAAQLSNIALWLNSIPTIIKLRQVLCEQIVNNSFRDPPASSGLKKSDVALCMYDILVVLIPFATMRSEDVQKGFGDDMVRAFISGIGGAWEGTSRGCIHALSICSLEIPSSVATLYPTIIDKMSKNMTQNHLTAHILEFLIQVALLPEMHSNLNPDEIQMIFGICIQYLEKTRTLQQSSITSAMGRINPTSRNSGFNFKRTPYRAAMTTDIGVPQYAAALAYHNILFWFLSLKLDIRAKFVQWIVPRLLWKNAHGEESIDEQGHVLIDMMQRTTFSDLGETSPDPEFAGPEDGPVSSASWIAGLSIVTVQTAGHSGKTHITKRQASGTTHAMYQQLTAPVPSHHRPGYTEIRSEEVAIQVLAQHVMLQRVASAAITDLADQPLRLPQEDYVQRALEGFDRIPTVTSHKFGVIFLGDGQTNESDYLANTSGSTDFNRLLSGLGYKVSLQPPLQFKPQGLEYPRDGEHTIAWRDRVEEVVYFVPTMMPTDLEEDPHCITKKAHVGNCHVNIIFNRSGVEWDMNNLRSQLNYVNIVVRPACRGRVVEDANFMPGFYRVQVVTRDDLPNISPAADPKIISAAQLPAFLRTLALNASMFCQTWNTKDDDIEFPSAWRARLQQIKKLKERVMKAGDKQVNLSAARMPASINTPPGTSSGRKTPVPKEEVGESKKDGILAAQLDFSSWTM
ncbi:Tuberous sclerosis 2-like protein [Cladophialophora chaetospira]|uniref:Tuberous sclerosis 2-like protein n=1 Tax=Cladophialophora chaetospira TaxID=386627 RepID=A0AA38XEV5_9EURO|nr:Tuberous sclerosis 2-like protein [Cladophialophora chaetospira]